MWCLRANENIKIASGVMTKTLISVMTFCGAEKALRSRCLRSFTVGHLQGTLNAARFQGVIPTVCGWAALWRLRRTILHPLTTPTLSNLIPETSGPDKPANEAFPAALCVCLPSGASNQMPNAADCLGEDPSTHSSNPSVCLHGSNKEASVVNQAHWRRRRFVFFSPFFSWDCEMRGGRGELTG